LSQKRQFFAEFFWRKYFLNLVTLLVSHSSKKNSAFLKFGIRGQPRIPVIPKTGSFFDCLRRSASPTERMASFRMGDRGFDSLYIFRFSAPGDRDAVWLPMYVG
jgi:hypothetical protein